MEAFVFSVNSVLPIFILIGIGWLIRRAGVLDSGAVSAINSIAFNVALPALLFREMVKSNITEVFHLTFILYAMSATVLTFAITWFFAERFFKDKPTIGSFVQGAFRGNYAMIGLMLIINVLGHPGKGVLLATFGIPIFNILSVVVITFRSNNPESGSIKNAAISLATNPLILGTLVGIPFALLQIPLFTSPHTKVIATAIDGLAVMANPLAMLAIGASISVRSTLRTLPQALAASAIKLAISPLVFAGLAYLFRNTLQFSGEDLLVLYVFLGVPTAVAGYIMANKMEANTDLSANILLVSSLLSVLTFTAGIYLFKAGGLI